MRRPQVARTAPGVRWLLFVAMLSGCAAETHAPEDPPYANWPDPLEQMPSGPQQTMQVCSRPGDDAVRDVFCGASPPELTSLHDLQIALQIDSGSYTGLAGIQTGRLTALSITSHSAALSARSVSSINPRVITVQADVMPGIAPNSLQFTAAAFARGEQFVELITRDRTTKAFSFYLVGFRQSCNAEREGCTPGDLLTPAIERDWIEVSLYDENDLRNTVLDCATCHASARPEQPKRLVMQELDSPWTHWFFQSSKGGQALLADYSAAKGDEELAGMTAEQIRAADPNVLTVLMLAVSPGEVPSFDSGKIEREVQVSAAAAGGNQPTDNAISGESATWRDAYRLNQSNGEPALPYYNVKVTDPAKLAKLTAAYQAFARGELERDELPDLRDIYFDDWTRRAELGVATAQGLDGRGVLLQACSLCHNERLDPSLTRARFRADLVGMGRDEKDRAIARLRLPPSDPLAMPPARLRVLSEQARERAIKELQR